MELSHILYKATTLSEAVKQFENNGFKVEYGSKTNPKNALIYFSEGPYIEILEESPVSGIIKFFLKFIGRKKVADRFDSWENAKEGYFDICLENYKDNFDDEVKILDDHNEKYFITNSSRLDTSNRLLKWKLLFPYNLGMPFFMTYFNIDPKPKNFVHPNGIKGVDKVFYQIDNSLIPIFNKLSTDDAIEFIGQKESLSVSFKK
tara:strand:+ start:155 stop:766 length:612 start_codon:yes stop_codon:yes gene_type:complete